MADESRQGQYRTALETLRESDGLSDADTEFINEFLRAHDKNNLTVQPLDDEGTKAYSTLRNYTNILRQAAERVDGELHEADLETVNSYIDDLHSGTHPDVKDGGLTANTVRNHSAALRLLYDYHGRFERTDIVMPDGQRSSVDETDMFESDEVEALRDACPNARDRCILELLIFTGQRVRALQTLRIKDLFLDDAMFRLNPEVDGLKGADGKRPLLGAEGPVKRWLQHHPASDDPENYLITCLPNAARGTPGDPIDDGQFNKRLKKIAREAGVEKPVNPHNFRHYFVTVCKRDYSLSDSQIKHLLGHRPDSDVMETTYAHLTDEEVATNVAVEAGFEEPTDDSPLSPPACTTCGEPLPENARACPMCGATFTPDANAAQETIEELSMEGALDADEAEEKAAVEALSEHLKQMLQDNPEMATELLRDAGVLDEG